MTCKSVVTLGAGIMGKKLYVVRVGEVSTEVEACGVYDAGTRAMIKLDIRKAESVRVRRCGQGVYTIYYNAELDGTDVMLYERKD